MTLHIASLKLLAKPKPVLFYSPQKDLSISKLQRSFHQTFDTQGVYPRGIDTHPHTFIEIAGLTLAPVKHNGNLPIFSRMHNLLGIFSGNAPARRFHMQNNYRYRSRVLECKFTRLGGIRYRKSTQLPNCIGKDNFSFINILFLFSRPLIAGNNQCGHQCNAKKSKNLHICTH